MPIPRRSQRTRMEGRRYWNATTIAIWTFVVLEALGIGFALWAR